MIVANDPTVKGGAYYPLTVRTASPSHGTKLTAAGEEAFAGPADSAGEQAALRLPWLAILAPLEGTY